MPNIITSHDVFEPLKQVLSASRDGMISGQKFGSKLQLSGPISCDIAILSLRYPISRDSFSGRLALPQKGAIPLPPLGTHFLTGASVRYPVLLHVARYLCDTPQKQARNNFARLSLQVSRHIQGRANHEVQTVNWNTGIFEAESA